MDLKQASHHKHEAEKQLKEGRYDQALRQCSISCLALMAVKQRSSDKMLSKEVIEALLLLVKVFSMKSFIYLKQCRWECAARDCGQALELFFGFGQPPLFAEDEQCRIKLNHQVEQSLEQGIDLENLTQVVGRLRYRLAAAWSHRFTQCGNRSPQQTLDCLAKAVMVFPHDALVHQALAAMHALLSSEAKSYQEACQRMFVHPPPPSQSSVDEKNDCHHQDQ